MTLAYSAEDSPNGVTADTAPLVLFVINSLAGGGAERVMLRLVQTLAEEDRPFRMALVLLDAEPCAYPVPEGVAVHILDGRGSLRRSLSAFLALARRERPAITLSFLTRSNIVTVAAARLLGHRAIISERVHTSSHFRRGPGAFLSRMFVRVAYPRAERVIAVSQGIADDLQERFGVPTDRLSIIPNPVDVDGIAAASRVDTPPLIDRAYAIVLSRLSANKNVMLAIEALSRSTSGLSLLILGDGPEREAIAARAKALGIADRVVMPGFLSAPYPHLARAHGFICPSNAEGFPNALVEALALGIPAVATNCPSGPSEILADLPRDAVAGSHDGPFGLLVPPNDPILLAEALDRLVEPPIHEALSKSGPARAQAFSVTRAVGRYRAIIEDMLASNSAR